MTWRATRAILGEVGAHLTPATRDLLAEELGDLLGPIVLSGQASGRTIEQHVLEPGMSLARAIELIASVCKALSEELSEDVLVRLRAELPGELAQRLAVPAESYHPVAQPLRPRDTVREPNPHGLDKLSSGRPRC
jgi:hypothetical protein